SIFLPLPIPQHCYLAFLLLTRPPPTHIYTLSLHDALPISPAAPSRAGPAAGLDQAPWRRRILRADPPRGADRNIRRRQGAWSRPDRKSTRLNSIHVAISYAVVCLRKKNLENKPGR